MLVLRLTNLFPIISNFLIITSFPYPVFDILIDDIIKHNAFYCHVSLADGSIFNHAKRKAVRIVINLILRGTAGESKRKKSNFLNYIFIDLVLVVLVLETMALYSIY